MQILVCGKPQFLPEVLEEIKEAVSDHIVISIVAGVNIKSIKSILGSATRIVRATCPILRHDFKRLYRICFSEDNFHDSEKEFIYKFFNAFGKYDIFNEKLMNAVTCASGSSPAYVYTFIEALADSVVSLGIPRDKAYTMVSQTILGAAAMVLEGGQHPAHLKDQVCSPAGTTIAGIKALEEFGFRNAIMKATDACYERAVELTEKIRKLTD